MIKLVSIVGIKGKFKVCAIDANGCFMRRYFDNLDKCFKWLAGCDKHIKAGVQS